MLCACEHRTTVTSREHCFLACGSIKMRVEYSFMVLLHTVRVHIQPQVQFFRVSFCFLSVYMTGFRSSCQLVIVSESCVTAFCYKLFLCIRSLLFLLFTPLYTELSLISDLITALLHHHYYPLALNASCYLCRCPCLP